MIDHHGRILASALLVALAGCAPTSSGTQAATSVEPSISVEPPAAPVASASPSEPAAAFSTAVFAGLGNEPRLP